MGIRIKRVAVLGAGVMGQGIAAHLANAGIPSYLFDIAPGELTEAEAAAGLSLEDRKVRNRITDAGIVAMKKSKPALLYRPDLAALVTPCNYEDDLDKLAECDWIVEVVVERIDIKQRVFAMVDEHRRPGSVVSSNTSGLSAAAMAEGRSDDFRGHFMVTHFFNPVRYMRLLEMVPIDDTDPDVFAAMADFGENVLGKGIVYCKDTPNFIANRIGTFGMASVFHWMTEYGVGVTEVDKVFGPAMGRPKSAVFRTADIVGLDTMAHVFATIGEGCPDDPWRDRFVVPAAMQALIEEGHLGAKTGAGFYKKVRGEQGSTILSLDLDTLDYVDSRQTPLASIGAARKGDLGEKIAAMSVRRRPRPLRVEGDRRDLHLLRSNCSARSPTTSSTSTGRCAGASTTNSGRSRPGMPSVWPSPSSGCRPRAWTFPRPSTDCSRGRRHLVRQARRCRLLLGRRHRGVPPGPGSDECDLPHDACRRGEDPRQQRGGHALRHGRRRRLRRVPHQDERHRRHHRRDDRNRLRDGQRRRPGRPGGRQRGDQLLGRRQRRARRHACDDPGLGPDRRGGQASCRTPSCA